MHPRPSIVPTSGSGGRPPSTADNVSSRTLGKSHELSWKPSPPKPSEARLTIIQVTDVYTLANFASLKTLIAETKKLSGDDAKVISVLTGDFLAPYLLSSVDRGAGMMNALAKTPIDYLTWGNHEADIDHRTVCRHVENFNGTWINTNMQDHETMHHEHHKPFEIITVSSPDGTATLKIGLIAVLSDDPNLYAQFKSPGPFGGATIQDPWDTLEEYKALLEGPEYDCDLVIPLQHLYVEDDHKTCRKFDFPVVLSGHDHHRVDEVVEGTRLLKPGLDAVYATVLDISLITSSSSAGNCKPTIDIDARFVKVGDWQPEADLHLENVRAYDALLPLRNTELARVPPHYEPLSSVNSRGCVTTMGKFICSLIKSSMNATHRQRAHKVDAVILMGGNIRGGNDYPIGSFFSLEALEAEVKADETLAVVSIPGWVLSDGIQETHAGDPIPGWMQYDGGVVQKTINGPVSHVGDEALCKDKMYRVATKIGDLGNGQSKTFTDYFKNHPERLPPKGAYVNIHAELMAYFARNVWRKVWEGIGPTLEAGQTFRKASDICNPWERLEKLDLDNDGIVSVEEIHCALRDTVGLSVDDDEMTLAKFVHSFADTSGDGIVDIADFKIFCSEMPMLYENDKWRLAFPRNGGVEH